MSKQSSKPGFIDPQAYLTKFKHFDWGLKGAYQQRPNVNRSRLNHTTLEPGYSLLADNQRDAYHMPEEESQ